MTGMLRHMLVIFLLATVSLAAQQWPHYAGDQAASHYSPLEQITAANVTKLAIAWEWKPNEKVLPQFGTRPGAFQNTPLVIDNVMYLSTPYNQVAALDATTGKELWRYDPKAYEDGQPPNGQGFAHRGVVAWRDREPAAHLHQRALQADPARCEDRRRRYRPSARTASSI